MYRNSGGKSFKAKIWLFLYSIQFVKTININIFYKKVLYIKFIILFKYQTLLKFQAININKNLLKTF